MLSPRESAAYVASLSKHVKIKIAKQLPLVELALADVREEVGVFAPKKSQAQWRAVKPPSDPAERLSWIFITTALNFSFWTDPTDTKNKFTVTYGGEKHTGYWSLCACFNKALEKFDVLSPSYIAEVSQDDARQIFCGDGGSLIPMLDERVNVLREVGAVLLKDFEGKPALVIEKAGKSAQRLTELLSAHFPCFRDVAEYEGKTVSFFKRAQLMTCDLFSAFDGEGYGAFDDIDTLTGFADYRLPQVFAHYGILEYSDPLWCKLRDKDALFTSGEPMEVEIRGCTLQVLEELTKAVNEALIASGHPRRVIVSEMDNFIWHLRRQRQREMASTPFHRIRTVFY